MNITLEGLSLQVSDLNQSLAFYTRIPGAVIEEQRGDQFARVRIGDGAIHLVNVGGKTGFHLEFNADNLTDTHEELQTAGLEPSRPQHHPWGKTEFHLTDPDGNVLEFGAFEG
jgi:catechol 2,3-dioxygenase-like lactoylglutathione lyase family enzyme